MAECQSLWHIKGNIYHYYDSKLAILFEILDNYLSRLRGRVIAIELDISDVQGSLEALCAEILNAYEGMDDEHKIQTEGIPLLPEDQQSILKGYQRDMVHHLEAFLSAANEDLKSDRRPCASHYVRVRHAQLVLHVEHA